jgi:two-component system, OmpR family, sensor histidine kinase CpxA
MLVICWIVMLLLTASVVFWPTVASPLQEDRQRTLPLHVIEACAKQQLEAYRSFGTQTFLRYPQGCPKSAQLVSSDNDAATDLAGQALSPEQARLVHRATQSHATAIRYLASSTIVAFEADSDLSHSPVYVVTFPMTHRNSIMARVNRLGRLVFISGLLSLLVAAYFVRPITRLNQMATAFGGGDLKARVNPSLGRRRDELGDLGRTFNDMAERIESLVIRYKNFLAHASHELGSPLTRLNIALALAKRKGGKELEQEHALIGQEADRLNSLVQELLLLARLESGNELDRKPIVFDIATVVQEASENAAFEGQQIKKTVILTTLETFSVSGYPDILARALDNVLRNGLRFAQQQVTIHVSVEPTSEMGIIVIEDDGPGVPEGSEDAIFEPFITVADKSSVDIMRGSGLGLAIARQAVIANGGRIFARRRESGGLAVVIEVRAQI